jgi:tRNA pseudouridine32 synthase / 23S rRNA pseudouridine746 synthase
MADRYSVPAGTITVTMQTLYQNDSMLVINKPAGLATIPGGWEPGTSSLVDLLGEQVGRLWVVHRLDRVTSGVVLFARTAEVHRELSILFEQHLVHKVYHAIVSGDPPWQEHTARHPLRINVGHSHRTVVDHGKGKPSETAFRVLERFNGYSLLEVIPATGRTHQVRVHAYALGYPLMGDTLYSGPAVDWIARPALHALSLSFEFEGQPVSFSAPYPPDFLSALEKLRAGQ